MRAIAASLAGLLAATAAATASTLSVAPLRIELSSAASTALLTLRTPGEAPVVVQAQPAAWLQHGDQEQLDDTRDLLVTPPLFTLPPKGQQVVRIYLRRKPDAARELDYRIVLAEVPPVAAAEGTGLRVVLHITLPVFVAPQTHAAPELTWHHTWTPDGTLQIEAQNHGASHIQILDFDAQSTDSTESGVHTESPRYLLPGSVVRWQLHAEPGLPRAPRLLVHGHSDAGDFSVTSDLGAE